MYDIIIIIYTKKHFMIYGASPEVAPGEAKVVTLKENLSSS